VANSSVRRVAALRSSARLSSVVPGSAPSRLAGEWRVETEHTSGERRAEGEGEGMHDTARHRTALHAGPVVSEWTAANGKKTKTVLGAGIRVTVEED